MRDGAVYFVVHVLERYGQVFVSDVAIPGQYLRHIAYIYPSWLATMIFVVDCM